VSFLMAGAGWALALRLTPEAQRPAERRRLLNWTIKGALIPVAIWMVMNLGVSWELQPFLPQIQAARSSGGSWAPAYFFAVAQGLLIVTSYWLAITLLWSLARTAVGLEGEVRYNFRALCLTSFVGMLIPAAALFWLGGWGVLGLALTALLAPAAGYAPAILRVKKMPPMYARAIARMKFGKYTEAEWEIIRELEKCEDDFDGWMMLAELYANQFHDLAEAEHTVLEVCNHARTSPSQLAVALHRLADWRLKLADDPEGARRALQMICDRLPGTHLSRMAKVRLDQLPATTAQLREQRISRPIPLPALGDHLDDAAAAPAPDQDRRQAVAAANSCVEMLRQAPNDIETRERLARIFSERLEQVDRGLEQLRLLLSLPGQPEFKRAEWLSLSAAWHIRYRTDPDSARAILEQIIEEFPHSPQSLAAKRRLQLMRTNQG
jgi:hypothetical protein